MAKSGQKGHRELKIIMRSLNVEYGLAKLRGTSGEQAVAVHQ